MIKRTHKIIHAVTGEVMYTSECTIDGNKTTGCINPFPYMQRKMHKLGVRPVSMKETVNNECVLYVK